MLEVHIEAQQKLLAKYSDMLIIKASVPWKGEARSKVDSERLETYACFRGISISEISAQL